MHRDCTACHHRKLEGDEAARGGCVVLEKAQAGAVRFVIQTSRSPSKSQSEVASPGPSSGKPKPVIAETSAKVA